MRAVILMVVAAAVGMGTVYADGSTPPKRYNYLHPPPALRKGNRHPASGCRLLALHHGGTPQFIQFTGDRQAGLGGNAGALRLSRPAKKARVEIAPVTTPRHLPHGLRTDGNAYRYTVTGAPGGRSARVRGTVGLVLAWPHRPKAVYRFAAGHWSRACAPPRWAISPGIVFCRVSALGTFLAVR